MDASGASTEISASVAAAVADAKGVDPVEMDERLQDWIDADALNALVSSMDDGHVEFDMAGHRVRVRSNGRTFVGQ